MTLPFLLSVPHAGLRVPPDVQPYCQLTEDEIIRDGDEGAAEIYALEHAVAEYVTTDVPRAVIDLNRAEDDRRVDGVVKTRTIWNEPIYREPLPETVIAQLIARYHRPYHARLSAVANSGQIRLAVDCHTMAAVGPPIGPDEGSRRPEVCLGDANGQSLPAGWIEKIAACFRRAFDGFAVTVNQPFSGGFITKTHGREMPWVQLELSRAPFLPNQKKRELVLQALQQVHVEIEASQA